MEDPLADDQVERGSGQRGGLGRRYDEARAGAGAEAFDSATGQVDRSGREVERRHLSAGGDQAQREVADAAAEIEDGLAFEVSCRFEDCVLELGVVRRVVTRRHGLDVQAARSGVEELTLALECGGLGGWSTWVG